MERQPFFSSNIEPTLTISSEGDQIKLVAKNNFDCYDSITKIATVGDAYLDILVEDLFLTDTLDGYLATVKFKNTGNVPIKEVELSLIINKTIVEVKELWTGRLTK